MSEWIICAGTAQAQAIAAYLQKSGTSCTLRHEKDAWVVRTMLKSAPGRANVVVGEGANGPDAVNIAAALVRDGCALGVVLVVTNASGSLRSRAKKAGITSVVTAAELSCAAAPRTPAVEHSQIAPVGGSTSRPPVALPSINQSAAGSSTPEKPRTNGDLRLVKAELPAETPPQIKKRVGVPVITFVSGRGGTGKSTLCAVAGLIAASWGMRVALLDLDLAFGNLGALCGAKGSKDIAGLLGDGSSPKALAPALNNNDVSACAVQVADGLEVYGPCKLPEYAEVVQPYAAHIIAALTHSHDLVLVDTTNNWNDAVASAAQAADRLAIVTDERAGSIPALARCGGLGVRLGIERMRMVRVQNGCDPRQRDEAFVARGAAGLECSRELCIMDGGPEAFDLLSAGQTRQLIEAANPLAESMATGLAQLLKELGTLPECESAQAALRGPRKQKKKLFSRSKQVSKS